MLKKPDVTRKKVVSVPPTRKIAATISAVAGIAAGALIILSAPPKVPTFIDVETWNGFHDPATVYINTKRIRWVMKAKDKDCFYICADTKCSLNETLVDKFRVCKQDNKKSYKIVENSLVG